MHFMYFDENKFAADNPYFFIGGIILKDEKLSVIEKNMTQIQYNFFGKTILTNETELHGVSIFQGKENFKGRKLADRIQLLQNLAKLLIAHKIPIRLVSINVPAHKA